MAAQDGINNRRVGARPANPLLLQSPDEHGFGVAGRRLGEMLFSPDVQ